MYEDENSELKILKELEKIATLNDESKLDYVVDILKNDRRMIVREAAAQCLKSFSSHEAAEKVFKLLYSEDTYIRNIATTVLAKYWPFSYQTLMKALKDNNKHIRKYALDALFLTNDPEAISLCSIVLNDEDINNVIAAVEYLGQTYDSAYVNEILTVLDRSIKNREILLSISCLESLANLCDERCFDKIREIIPEPEKLDELMIPSYLKLFSRICRFQDSYILFLVSSEYMDKFYKEIIDATKDYLAKYFPILDDSQKEIIYNWLYKLYTDYHIPSENLYEILIMLSEIDPKRIVALIPELLSSKDVYVKLGAFEIIERLRLIEFKDLLKKFINNAETERRNIIESHEIKDQKRLDSLETLIAAASNVLSTLENTSTGEM